MQQLMARANKNMTKISYLPLTRANRQIDIQTERHSARPIGRQTGNWTDCQVAEIWDLSGNVSHSEYNIVRYVMSATCCRLAR